MLLLQRISDEEVVDADIPWLVHHFPHTLSYIAGCQHLVSLDSKYITTASVSALASVSSCKSHVHLLDSLIRIAQPELGPVRSAGLVSQEPLEALGPHKPRQHVCQLHLDTRVSSLNWPAVSFLKGHKVFTLLNCRKAWLVF